MAGLTTNIVTSKNRAHPLWPQPTMTNTPFFGMNDAYSGIAHLPPFANADDSKSSIRVNLTSTNAPLLYYDEDGTQITDGVWGSTGLTVAEAASNSEQWGQLYMDATDNMLYMVTHDTGTTPDTLYLSKVDKAGSVTAIGSGAQLGNDSMSYSSNYWLSSYSGPMYRSGGDGSGNFVLPFSATAGGSAASAVPARGVNITVSASDGSLSYSSLFGTNYAQPNAQPIFGAIGPTANNMYGGLNSGSTPNNTAGNPPQGSITNTSTGRTVMNVLFNTPLNFNALSTIKTIRWRSQYIFTAYSNKWGPTIYDEVDMHNYLDEMAVYYGLL